MTVTGQDSAGILDELATLAERLRRSTVQVRARGPSRRPALTGGGSGVIWSSNGLIITNAHVAQGPHAIVALHDGSVLDAVLVARDPEQDLAALRVETDDLPAASIGQSDALRVGELVLAVGNPLGLLGALATGIIHATGLRHQTGLGSRTNWIQADIRLAPGNSGGPLADARGRVIGVNSMVAGGLAFAVPSRAVAEFLDVRSGGEPRPYIGVDLQPVLVPLERSGEVLPRPGQRNGSPPEDKRVPGLLVLEVSLGSPAEKAGLLMGDVLIGIGGRFAKAAGDLLTALSHARPNRTLQIDLIRGGRILSRHVLVGERDQAAEAA